MPDDVVDLTALVFRLRVLVLALGEKVDPPWWRTQFFTTTGQRFLERLFPRTPLLAAVNSAGKPASELHDQAVGRVGAFHLFRLPKNLEFKLIAYGSDLKDTAKAEFFDPSWTVEQMLDLIRSLADGAPPSELSPGAVKLGKETDLSAPAVFREMAAIYLNAFITRTQAFPYVVLDKTETAD